MPDLSIPLAGITRASERVDSAASHIARATAPPDEAAPGDVVELTPAMVALLEARTDYLANIKAAHVVDETNQSLLDSIE
jgi:hypothetical protein